MNKYLEKIASTALIRNLAKGAIKSVTGIARNGERMGAAQLNHAVTGGTSPASLIRTPATRKIIGEGGIKGIREAENPARAVPTGDALARQGSIKQRLAANKAADANGRVKTSPTKTVFGNPINPKPSGTATPIGSKPVGAPSTPTSTITTPGSVGKVQEYLGRHKAVVGAAAGAGVLGYAAGQNSNNNR